MVALVSMKNHVGVLYVLYISCLSKGEIASLRFLRFLYHDFASSLFVLISFLQLEYYIHFNLSWSLCILIVFPKCQTRKYLVNATKDSSDVTVKSDVCRHTNVIFCPCYCTDNDGVKVSSMNFPQIMSKINPFIFVLDIIASNLEEVSLSFVQLAQISLLFVFSLYRMHRRPGCRFRRNP